MTAVFPGSKSFMATPLHWPLAILQTSNNSKDKKDDSQQVSPSNIETTVQTLNHHKGQSGGGYWLILTKMKISRMSGYRITIIKQTVTKFKYKNMLLKRGAGF